MSEVPFKNYVKEKKLRLFKTVKINEKKMIMTENG